MGEKLLRPDLFGVSFQERWRSSFISRCQRCIIYSSGICFHCSRRCGLLHLLSNTHNAAFIFHRCFFFLPSFNMICILFLPVNTITSCPTDSGVGISCDQLCWSLFSERLYFLLGSKKRTGILKNQSKASCLLSCKNCKVNLLACFILKKNKKLSRSMSDAHQSKFNYSTFHFGRGLIWGVAEALYLSMQGRARESGGGRGRRGGVCVCGGSSGRRQSRVPKISFGCRPVTAHTVRNPVWGL